MAGTRGRPGLRTGWAMVLLALAAGAALAPPAAAEVALNAPGTTFTGASYFASVDVSDPSAVVLVEWDFDGDGHFDANHTDSFDAGYRYVVTGDVNLTVVVTWQTGSGLATERNTTTVHVATGSPNVSIVVPERAVAGVPQEFRAVAQDPDPSPAGEQFRFVWAVDGRVVDAVGPAATIEVDGPGLHVIQVQVTDEEGISVSGQETVDFQAPGLFEGRQGVVNLGLLIAAASLAVGFALLRASQRSRRRASVRKEAEVASASELVAAGSRRGKPEKVPFQAAAEHEPATGGARIVVGGAPAALARTKECPVCHNAIDADLDPADCPFCKANAEAESIESELAGDRFKAIDLSEVRALLQRARRERHLGRTEVHSRLVAQARDRAEELVEERESANDWLERARHAVERASAKVDAERLDRAHSYLKLAESLSKAYQHGKVRRHAQRCVELLAEGAAGADTPDRCHACGGAIAAARAAGAQRCPHCDTALLPESPDDASAAGAREEEVREELHSVRDMLTSGQVAPDEEAWSLLREAEAFEREAAWAQALELLRALRERFERERAAAGEGPAPGKDA